MKFLVYIHFRIYLFWSAIYRKIQRIYWCSDYADIKQTTELEWMKHKKNAFPDSSLNKIPVTHFSQLQTFWKHIMNDISWRKDPWNQLWDAVSDPFVSYYLRGDDCDGFAFMATKIIGEYLRVGWSRSDYDVYRFASISFVINYKKKRGHAVSIWKEEGGQKIIIVSNKEVKKFQDRAEFLTWFNQVFFKPSWIVETDKKLKIKEIIRL